MWLNYKEGKPPSGLASLTGITTLLYRYPKIQVISDIASLSQLHTLHCSEFTRSDLEAIVHLPLRKIRFISPQLGADDFVLLSQVTTLNTLQIFRATRLSSLMSLSLLTTLCSVTSDLHPQEVSRLMGLLPLAKVKAPLPFQSIPTEDQDDTQ